MIGLIIIVTVAAFFGATLSGVVGMGGGILLLSTMFAVGMKSDVAIPVHGAVQIVSNASRTLAFIRHVRWRPALILMAAATPAPILGLWLRTHVSEGTIRAAMGVMALVVTWRPAPPRPRLCETRGMIVAGILGGTFGVVVGAVGPILAPFFLRPEIPKEQIVATKAICAMYLHTIKLIAFAGIGYAFVKHLDLVVPMAAAVILGTLAGRWLIHKIDEQTFRRVYRAVLTVLAIRLLIPG